LPAELIESLGPIVETVGSLTEQIKDYDRRIEQKATEEYPETELLRQAPGVGALTALTFVLTIEDSQRFEKAAALERTWGCLREPTSLARRMPRKASRGQAMRC
jgi:transposase